MNLIWFNLERKRGVVILRIGLRIIVRKNPHNAKQDMSSTGNPWARGDTFSRDLHLRDTSASFARRHISWSGPDDARTIVRGINTSHDFRLPDDAAQTHTPPSRPPMATTAEWAPVVTTLVLSRGPSPAVDDGQVCGGVGGVPCTLVIFGRWQGHGWWVFGITFLVGVECDRKGRYDGACLIPAARALIAHCRNGAAPTEAGKIGAATGTAPSGAGNTAGGGAIVTHEKFCADATAYTRVRMRAVIYRATLQVDAVFVQRIVVIIRVQELFIF
jgi:hypothetical protein